MRKKFTMLLASLFLVMGTAWAQVYQKIPHTEWTVTALNEARTQGNEGGLAYLKDENPETFYHSDYDHSYSDGNPGKTKGQDGLQAFMVELPEVMSFDKITYKGRSNGPNNWATKARIYVFETLPEGWPKDGENYKTLNNLTYAEKEALLKRTDNTVLGTPAFDNYENGTWAANENIKTAELTSTQQGKYVLFVADATTGTNGYLCCGDFHLWQKLEGIVEDKPYFLKIASIEGDWYLDTKTPMNDNQGRTIGKSATPVPTYFTLNDGYWYISTMPGNEGNYISVDQWCATPQSATAAKWTMVKNDDGSYYLLQNNYGTGSNRFLGGLADNGKVYTDQNKENAIKIRLVELDEVQTASEAARVLLSHVGVGYPAVDSEARTTLQAAIDAEGATAESINAAIATYQAKTQTVQMPEIGKVYRLISGVPNFSHKKAIYSNNTEMRWQNRDVNAMNQLWAVLSISGNDITLINVNDGLYPKNLGSGASVTVSTVKNECSLEFLGKGQFQIKANKQQGMHANSHGNGTGTAGNIINYNNANPNTASAWYFEEVAVSQAILNKQIASIENSHLTSLLMKQEGVAELQAAVDAAKSATENYADAFVNLAKAMNEATIEQIDLGYFYIKSKGAGKYACNNNTNLKVADSKESPKTIFKLTKANSGTFYIQNGNGLYVQRVAQSQNVGTAASALEYTITRLQSGYYALRPTNSLENREFWHDANNGTGNIVGWSNDADNTQWAFEALTVDEMSKIYSVKDLNLSSSDGYVSYNGEYNGDKDVKQAGGFYLLNEVPTSENFTITSSNTNTGMLSTVEVNGNSLSVNVGYDAKNIYLLRCKKNDSYARYHSECRLNADDATNMLTYEGNKYYESLFFIDKGEGDYDGYYTIRSVAAPTLYAYNLGTADSDSKVAMKEAPAEGDLTSAYYWKISSFNKEIPANITPWGGDDYGWNKRGSYNSMGHIGYWQGGNGTDDNKWYVCTVEEELIPLHSRVGYPTEENVEKYRPYAQYINEAGFNKLKNASYDIILPEKGKYYRIKNNGGTGYLSSGTGTGRTQFVAGIAESTQSIFYYDGKLLSYKEGLYLNSSDNKLVYSNSTDNGVEVVFEESRILGKLQIKFSGNRYLFSSSTGNTDSGDASAAYIDPTGGNPAGRNANYLFTVEEVDMSSVIEELNALATDATAAATLEYLTDEEKTALTTAADNMSAAATTLTNGGFVKDMTAEMEALIDAAMNVMTHYDLTVQPFRLKQTASGLYMVASNPATIASKSEDVTNQAFNLVATETEGVYNLKSVGGLYMQVDDYLYQALPEGEAANKVHEMEYIGRGKYNIKTASDYVASDATDENSTLWSNKDKENTNGVWEFELLPQAAFTYSYKYNDVEKRTEQVVGYIGCPYPTPALELFGVVPAAVAGNVSVSDEGTTIDVSYTVDLPFIPAESYDGISHWYFMKIRDDGFTYMGYDESKSYIKASESSVPAASKDAYTWGFVGNPFDGFSIVNLATGKAKILSAPVAPNANQNADQLARMVEVTDNYTGNLVWNVKAPTHANPEPGVFYLEHPTATDYAINRQELTANDYSTRALCYWSDRDSGSAIQVVERGIYNLEDLNNNNYIYVLAAERSPLLYDAAATNADKLSSGLVSGVSADVNDINQQFLIIKDGDASLYYLYNIGAQRFVDANLFFSECPEPVLSLETYSGENDVLYPWCVKIADKYVVPSNSGQDGNKIYLVSNPSDDGGKRYRIIPVEEADPYLLMSVGVTIEASKSLIRKVEDLQNNKVYTVTTFDRGGWMYNGGETALWSTREEDPEHEGQWLPGSTKPEEEAQQFAFLTVNGKTYLYSVGARKFVVKSNAPNGNKYYATYSDEPVQTVDLLPATNGGWFPVVVKLDVDGDNQIAISNSYEYPVIMHNALEDPGNQVRIEEAGEYDFTSVIEDIKTYQLNDEAIGGLNELITEATEKNTFLKMDALTTAIAAAQEVLDTEGATYQQLMEAKESLAAVLNDALYVTEITEFTKATNAYVYTFLSNRDNLAYMMYDGTNKFVASHYKQTSLEVGADKVNCQWVVYTSDKGNYYMYNLGAQMFMGTESAADTSIPFSETPKTTNLKFKKSGVATHPIMISSDGGNGAINHSNNAHGGKNIAGIINWAGGFSFTEDPGNVHQVAIVGALTETTLKTIADAVKLYETRGVAIEALDAAIAEARAKVDAQRDVPGYYSSTNENAADDLAAIIAFRGEIDSKGLAEIEAKTAEAQAISASFKFNMPKADKFYVLRCNHEDRYIYTKVDNKLYWSGDNLSEVYRAVWQFEAGDAEGTFKMKNVHNGSYIPSIDGAHVSMTDAGADVIIAPSPTVNGAVIFSTREGGNGLHAHGTENRVIGYGNNAGANHYFFEEVTTFSYNLTVTAANYSTLYLNYPVAVPGIEGANEENEYGVYVASEIASNYVALKLVEAGDVLPAKTGIVIKAPEDDYTFTYSSEESSDVTSMFEGTLINKNIVPAENTVCYVLANGSNGVGMYKAELNLDENTAFLNNANKAYLPVPVGTSQQPAQALSWRFTRGGDEGTTDIEKSESRNEKSEMIFDLQGRRVLNPAKGMYIVNGKKVLF